MSFELKIGGGVRLPIVFSDSEGKFTQPLITIFDGQISLDFSITDTDSNHVRYFRIKNNKKLKRRDPFSILIISQKKKPYKVEVNEGKLEEIIDIHKYFKELYERGVSDSAVYWNILGISPEITDYDIIDTAKNIQISLYQGDHEISSYINASERKIKDKIENKQTSHQHSSKTNKDTNIYLPNKFQISRSYLLVFVIAAICLLFVVFPIFLNGDDILKEDKKTPDKTLIEGGADKNQPKIQTEKYDFSTGSISTPEPVTCTGGAQTGDMIEVDYIGTYDNGIEFDSSYKNGQTFSLILGSGGAIPGFDKALHCMEVGEKKKFTLSPDEAYGEYDLAKIVSMPIDFIPAAENAAVGDRVSLFNGGELFQATILDMNATNVTFDLNSPLAGKSLTFEVTVRSIKSQALEGQYQYQIRDGKML